MAMRKKRTPILTIIHKTSREVWVSSDYPMPDTKAARFECLAYVMGDIPPHYPMPACSLYYDGPKHIAVAFQQMTHLVTPDCGARYWLWDTYS